MAKVGRKRTPSVDRWPSGDIRQPRNANYVVYAIGPEGGGGPCKIGYAARSDYRLGNIQTSHWDRLDFYEQCFVDDVAMARKVEKLAHESLKDRRIRGEWFDVGSGEASFAVAMAKEQIAKERLTEVENCVSSINIYTGRGV